MTGITIRRTVAICTLAFGLVWTAAPAFAQSGQIKGKVTDAQGAIIDGATVLIENLDNGSKPLTTKTNKKGEYIQVGLYPGATPRIRTGNAERHGTLDRLQTKIQHHQSASSPVPPTRRMVGGLPLSTGHGPAPGALASGALASSALTSVALASVERGGRNPG